MDNRAAVLAFFLGAMPALARADVLLGPRTPTLEWGGFVVHPFMRLSETYNSNIFLDPAGSEVGSWMHQANPGFKAGLESGSHRVDLNYEGWLQLFTKDPSKNNAYNQGAGLLYKYAGPEFTARLKEDYLNTVDPPNSEQTGRQRRWQNVLGGDAEYAPEDGSLFVGAEASHAAHKYVADNSVLRERLNRYEQRAGAKAGYRIAPKTRAYGTYRRGVIHYTADATPPTKNNKSHALAAGFETEIANMLDARAEAGIERRRYDEEAVAGGGRDAKSLIFDARLGYSPLERTRLELTASRSLQEATFFASRFFTATGGALSLSHRFPEERLAVALRGGYERDVYSESFAARSRRDDIYRGRAGVELGLRDWAKLEASYEHRVRFSPGLEQFNYRAHIASLGVVFSL
jgi:hypothetical protein